MPEGKSEIPADVMEAARLVADDWDRLDWNSYEGNYVEDLAEDIAQALLAERQSDRWLPIETAPKDGSDIIVYNPSGEGIVGEAYYSNDNGRGGWWWAGTYEGEHMEEPMHIRNAWPTHWQPLPAPPSSTEER
jgi:hypothetical protein